MVPWYKTRRAWAEAALILVLTAALVAVVFAACAGDGESADPPATSTTVDPDEAVKEEVRQAYRDFLKMAFRIAEAPDPNDPEIALRATGDARGRIEQSAADDQARGVVVRGGPDNQQTILTTTVTGDAARLNVCFVDNSGVFDAATGEEIEPMTTTTRLGTIDLVRESGGWKVSLVETQEGKVWDGVHDCSE
jgi:hypothetical protein